MTAFRDALSAALGQLDLTQVQASQLFSIDQSFLSRLLSGKSDPSSDTMRAIYGGMSQRDPAAAEALVFAYLRDEVAAIGMNPRRAVIQSIDAAPGQENVRVAPELHDAFEWMAEAAIYPEVAAMIRSHGELCKRHFAAMADAATVAGAHKGSVYPISNDSSLAMAAEDPLAVVDSEVARRNAARNDRKSASS